MASGVYCAAMDTAPPDPGLAVDPAAAGRHFGAGGGVPDLTGALCGMLADLAGYHLRMVKLTTEQAEKAGHLGHEEAVVLEIVSRSTRRTLALMARLHAESKKTPEQLAAERAQRAAAAERALLREKKAKVERSAAAVVGREAGPSDRENLLSDLHERLLYPDIDIALLQEDVSAVVLRVLKDLKITPQQETWSDALMATSHASRRSGRPGRPPPPPAWTGGRAWSSARRRMWRRRSDGSRSRRAARWCAKGRGSGPMRNGRRTSSAGGRCPTCCEDASRPTAGEGSGFFLIAAAKSAFAGHHLGNLCVPAGDGACGALRCVGGLRFAYPRYRVIRIIRNRCRRQDRFRRCPLRLRARASPRPRGGGGGSCVR
jgi:hypothetical protein